MTKEQFEQKAAALLEASNLVTVSSVHAEGYPRPCVMAKLKSDGFGTVWFATGTDSRKTADFKKNAKAGLSYHDQDDSVTLIGKAEIIEDMDVKKEMWSDWLLAHFSGGVTDPNYCLIRFTAEEATYYLGGEFCTFRCGEY